MTQKTLELFDSQEIGSGKIRELFSIVPVNHTTAMELVVKFHYLHREAPCSQAFGLLHKEQNRVVGVVVYGKPSSPALCRGICGLEESENVIELTRLWIEDGTPKNAESFLIGNTIPLVEKEIIVSYAEIGQGHKGGMQTSG